MENIKRIIRDDLYSVTHNLFALIVAIGVCILPALYAWFNIYANWDPYENTGNLDMAVVSLDKGYVNDDGEYDNVGKEVIDDLKTSDSVRWHFVDSEEEAKEGVESGEYYGSIVINPDFTYNMYKVFTENVDKPQMVFYQNQKKNPVATKISDTVVEKTQSKINSKFVKVMTTQVFEDVNEVSDDIEEDGGIDGLVRKMEKISEDMKCYQNTINSLIAGNAVLKTAINSASSDSNKIQEKTNASADALSQTRDSVKTTQDTLNDYNNQVNLVVATVQTSLSNIQNRLNEAALLNDMKAINATAKGSEKDIQQVQTDLDALREALREAEKGSASTETKIKIETALATIRKLDISVAKVDTLVNGLLVNNVGDGIIKDTESKEADVKKKIQDAQIDIADSQASINNELIPQLDDTMNNLEIVLNDASTLMRKMSSTISGMGNVFSSLQNAVNAGNISLSKTSDAIGEIDKRLDKIIDKVNKASNNEKVQILLDTLKGDPELYGEFFSEPVKIETINVYPVENYGSAVAPFYTVLAIWVGAIILAAIVKPTPNTNKYPDYKPVEIFFGRYGLFFLMGQLQTLVIVVGDIALLGIQCLHPFLFYLASVITSLTFTLVIYALVAAFGDVGKAIAVVILVIQIAGSSGTYPIELLPEFFRRVYLFFPFPYAINALRECVGGLYELDYVKYLLELSIFIILGLVIGIWIRKPFDSLKRYMQKRMEDTEVL